MELSYFLAKLMGLYLLMIGLIGLTRKKQFQYSLKSSVSSPAVVAFSGVISLIGGLAILIGNPIWELSWRMIPTLIGVLAILQGIIRIGFPEEMRNKLSKLDKMHWPLVICLLLLGGYLTYHGYMQ